MTRAATLAAALALMRMQRDRQPVLLDDFDRPPIPKRPPVKPKIDKRADVKAARKQRISK